MPKIHWFILPTLLFCSVLLAKEESVSITADPKDAMATVYEKAFTPEGKGKIVAEGRCPLSVPMSSLEKVGHRGIVLVVGREQYESYELYVQPPYKEEISVKLKKSPTSYGAGLELFHFEKYQEAIPLFEKSAQENPTNCFPEIMLAYSYYGLGDLEGGEAHIKQALSRNTAKAQEVIAKDAKLSLKRVFGVCDAQWSDKGITVGSVEQGSKAERGGMQPGDVITSINGHPVKNQTDFMKAFLDVSARGSYSLATVKPFRQDSTGSSEPTCFVIPRGTNPELDATMDYLRATHSYMYNGRVYRH